MEMLPDILTNLDEDVTAVIKKAMKRAKTEILLETKVECIEKERRQAVVHVADKEGKAQEIEAEKDPPVCRKTACDGGVGTGYT